MGEHFEKETTPYNHSLIHSSKFITNTLGNKKHSMCINTYTAAGVFWESFFQLTLDLKVVLKKIMFNRVREARSHHTNMRILSIVFFFFFVTVVLE